MQFLYYPETVSLSNSSPKHIQTREYTPPTHTSHAGASQGAMAPPPFLLCGDGNPLGNGSVVAGIPLFRRWS